MEKKPWVLVNDENVKGYVCGDGYVSKMMTGDEMAGFPILNINMGMVPAHGRTGGAAHEDAEIYFMYDVGEGSSVWLDDDEVPVKNGDIIVIPPHVFHYIDNQKCDKPFKLYTYWPRQEQNEMFFIREKAWGTSVAYLDPDYTKKRLNKE